MTPQTAQEKIAREFLEMTSLPRPPRWFKRGQSPDGKSGCLPNLNTEAGVALWEKWIKAELWQRKFTVKLYLFPYVELIRCNVFDFDGNCFAGRNADTELAALTAAVLKLMEAT